MRLLASLSQYEIALMTPSASIDPCLALSWTSFRMYGLSVILPLDSKNVMTLSQV